jgi:hypothetical protein
LYISRLQGFFNVREYLILSVLLPLIYQSLLPCKKDGGHRMFMIKSYDFI